MFEDVGVDSRALQVARRKTAEQNQYVKYMSLCQYAIHVKVHCEISQSEMFIEQHKLSYVIPTLPLDNYAVQ